MKYVNLPNDDNEIRPLPFYLAMEEFLAASGKDDMFFMWQVEPTVIFGRNQLIDNEVDIDYCRANNIAVYRRKSGGGCVFADMNNIMFSYITTSSNVIATFNSYTDRVAGMLRRLGLDAHASGRNDIMIGDGKVSGNAFYNRNGRAIVHGTMLYDFDPVHISKAITPSRQKLESKGVESVRNRVTRIREHSTISLADFKRHARHWMSDEEIRLTDSDVAEIQKLSRPYYSDQWIYGHNPRCEASFRRRIPGVGEFSVEIEMSGNKIKRINLSGDFFLLSDIDSTLLDRLTNVDYNADSISRAIIGLDVSTVIAGLTNDQFINLITQN